MAVIEQVRVSLLEMKFDQPRGGSGMRQVDLIVADMLDVDGGTGLGFSYVLGGGGGLVATAARQQAERHLTGQPLLHPGVHWRRIEAGFNRIGHGPNLLALAALDVALWDLSARRAGQPLGIHLGGDLRPAPIYGSGGFSPDALPEASAEVALAHCEAGFRGVKPRVNAQPGDAPVMAAVRAAIGERAQLMVDANEKGSLERARRLLRAAADHGVLWVEEPLPARDLLGYRHLSGAPGAAVATGEHFQGLDRFALAMADRMASVIQPDLAMAGGLTPCLEVARLASAHGLTVAPHFLPGLFAHFAGAFSASLWLEDFPLLEDFMEGWPNRSADGTLAARETPGHGLSIPADVRKRHGG